MRKLRFVGLLTLALSFAALSGLAQRDRDPDDQDDRDDEYVRHVNAPEMSALGLLAASALGAGFYLVRRRTKSRE